MPEAASSKMHVTPDSISSVPPDKTDILPVTWTGEAADFQLVVPAIAMSPVILRAWDTLTIKTA